MTSKNLDNKIEDAYIIKEILHLVKLNEIKSVPGFEDVPLYLNKPEDLSHLSTNELKVLLEIINKDAVKMSHENEISDTIQHKIMNKIKNMEINYIPNFQELNFKSIIIQDLEPYTEKELEILLRELNFYETTSVVIDQIMFLVNKMDLIELPQLAINFNEITDEEMRYVNTADDREFILKTLKDLYEERCKEGKDIINPLEVIEKYRDGAIKKTEKKTQNNIWRKNIPNNIKKHISGWQSDSLEVFYEKTKDFMNNYSGYNIEEIRTYVCDLSELVFEEEHEVVEEFISDEQDTDTVSSIILRLVEMIILPHQEVLDRIEEKGGQVLFSDIWNQSFNESLKTEVKDRDNWTCVICDSDKGLHVHHKIPRKYGGVNHKDNLVTLCDQCHPAIETANIKHAYSKCVANYWRNCSKNIIKPVPENKDQLKKDVQNNLDSLVVTLSNRNENKLVEDVIDIMKDLDEIFYD
ncbi:HNH endonuclease [Salipaludibacillus daqingensis]|uniref:HNH endonuclease n=1 Tax=Salipaludibacillus daqingensis TaxID=3041001 RepID=UPI0024771975|nr:HNH endonuclease [Salipaludibacillus daqingensis]